MAQTLDVSHPSQTFMAAQPDTSAQPTRQFRSAIIVGGGLWVTKRLTVTKKTANGGGADYDGAATFA